MKPAIIPKIFFAFAILVFAVFPYYAFAFGGTLNNYVSSVKIGSDIIDSSVSSASTKFSALDGCVFGGGSEVKFNLKKALPFKEVKFHFNCIDSSYFALYGDVPEKDVLVGSRYAFPGTYSQPAFNMSLVGYEGQACKIWIVDAKNSKNFANTRPFYICSNSGPEVEVVRYFSGTAGTQIDADVRNVKSGQDINAELMVTPLANKSGVFSLGKKKFTQNGKAEIFIPNVFLKSKYLIEAKVIGSVPQKPSNGAAPTQTPKTENKTTQKLSQPAIQSFPNKYTTYGGIKYYTPYIAVNPQKASLNLALAAGTLFKAAGRSALVNTYRADAAMAGPFFWEGSGTRNNLIHSHYVLNGKVHSILNCSLSACIGKDGGVDIGRMRTNLVLKYSGIPDIDLSPIADASGELDNKPYINKELNYANPKAALYTEKWRESSVGTSVSRKMITCTVIFDESGNITANISGGASIPKNGYALALGGQFGRTNCSKIKKGGKMSFDWRAAPGNDVNISSWISGCKLIVGGMHTAIADGKQISSAGGIKSYDDCFNSNAWKNTWRSVFAKGRDGMVYFIVIWDNAAPEKTGGIVNAMGLNVQDAFNFDGGASSFLYANNGFINQRNPDTQGVRAAVPSIMYAQVK